MKTAQQLLEDLNYCYGDEWGKVVETLGRLGDPIAIATLVNYIERLDPRRSPYYVHKLAEALGRL